MPLIRQLADARWMATQLLRRGRPRVVITFNGGIGDDLLCTAIFRECRKRGMNRGLWMVAHHPSLFEHNPDVDQVVPYDGRFLRLAKWTGARPVNARYCPDYRDADDRDPMPPVGHLISLMAAKAGLTGTVGLRPYFHLTDTERSAGRKCEEQIAIQSGGLTARAAMLTKQWYPERFQQVVDALRDRFNFVQLGSPDDPPLAGVALDLRGKSNVRESAAILANSRLLVGTVGLLMHLARAVDTRAVIVYGGRETPWQTGYTCNENLYNPVACSPCWLRNRCPYDRACMQEIQAMPVVEAIERAAAKVGQPLVVDAVPVGSDVRNGPALSFEKGAAPADRAVARWPR